jgi:hypothetical protein
MKQVCVCVCVCTHGSYFEGDYISVVICPTISVLYHISENFLTPLHFILIMHSDYFCIQHSVVGLCGGIIFLISTFNLILSIIYTNFGCERAKHSLYLHTQTHMHARTHTQTKYVSKVRNLIKVTTRSAVSH